MIQLNYIISSLRYVVRAAVLVSLSVVSAYLLWRTLVSYLIPFFCSSICKENVAARQIQIVNIMIPFPCYSILQKKNSSKRNTKNEFQSYHRLESMVSGYVLTSMFYCSQWLLNMLNIRIMIIAFTFKTLLCVNNCLKMSATQLIKVQSVLYLSPGSRGRTRFIPRR